MTATEAVAPEAATTNVCVAVHVRPLVENESMEGCQEVLYTTPGEPQVSTPTNHSFTFDHVYGPSAAPSSKLFHQCVDPLVQGLFKGYNATVLAYGQTGSGKTYTMGSAFAPGRAQQGVIPQAMELLFTRIAREAQNADFTVRVGFVEIHKEEIRDLLVHEPENLRPSVTVREAQGGGVCLAGAKEQEVTTYHQMAEVLEQGSLARHTASTNMNSQSSRSHAIFTITLEQRKKAGSKQSSAKPKEASEDEAEVEEREEDAEEDDYLCAKMHLVDLAGSERAKRTKAEGQRLKEGIHINKGLLALGNVISALCDEHRVKSAGHVPYRDSKLTRLLQDSLGGNSRTCMIACVSPADINLEETLNTLKYAARARNIRNKPVVNRDAGSAQVTHLRQQLAAARAEVACLKKAIHGGPGGSRAQAGDALMQAALEELEAQAAGSEKEVQRLRVQMESLQKEADDNYSAKLAAQAERDLLQHRLHLAKEAGFVEDDADGSLDQSQLQLQLDKIARLESENRRLKQVHHLSSTYMTARRQSGVGATGTPGKMPVTPGCPSPFGGDSFHFDLPSTPVPEEDELEEQARSFEHDRLGLELHKLQGALEEKEQQLMELQARSKVSALKEHYDRVLNEANSERETLSKEKSSLMAKLQSLQASNAENRKRLEQKYRGHIRELETKMKAASRRAAEATRYERLKSRMDDHCQRLQDEITRMKQQKVALAKAVEQSNKEMNQYKRKRDKELAQVKRAGMKSAAEVQKLSALHDKQQQVLKRKTEEAEAARRRLRELSGKANSSQRKPRVDMAATLAKEDHKTEASRRDWVEKELEMENQVLDMQRVLDGEMALRGDCARQLAEVRRQLTAVQHPELLSPGSLASLSPKQGNDTEASLVAEEKRLEEAIKEHSGQIALLQDSILKANAEEEAANSNRRARDEKDLKRWEFVRSIPEARIMLRTVFRTASTARSLACETDALCAEIRDELELVRLQYQQAEFEAKMAKRSAAAAEAACAAALANSAANQTNAPSLEPSQEDGELAELLQELDSVQVEMTGGDGGTPSLVAVSQSTEFVPDSAAALRYADEVIEEEEDLEELEDEEEFDEDDDEADPTWNYELATPVNRAAGRRRGRSTSGKFDHWRHPASTGSAKSEGTDVEQTVRRGINRERAAQGQVGVDKLTVQVLKDFLKGKTINGGVWKAGQKAKPQLLEDAQIVLSSGTTVPGSAVSNYRASPPNKKTSRRSGSLPAAVTPVPTLRGLSTAANGNCGVTPSTQNARESAHRYLQMATAARQRAAALKHDMEKSSSSSRSEDIGKDVPHFDVGEVTSVAPPSPLAERNMNVVGQSEAPPKRKLLNPEQHLAAMIPRNN